jgi:large subunit ribosomal protein L25
LSNQIDLDAHPRTSHGKGAAARLRRTGRVPAILYGQEVSPVAISLDARALYHALHTPAGRNVLIRLSIDGEKHLAVARDIQIDPRRRDVIHVDLLAVDRNTRITAVVPVHITDQDQLVRDGGVVSHALHSVAILVAPQDTPNSLDVSVAGMSIGDVRRVEDLAGMIPSGAELTGDLNDVVVAIEAPTTGSLESDEATSAEAAPAAEGSEGAAGGSGDE